MLKLRAASLSFALAACLAAAIAGGCGKGNGRGGAGVGEACASTADCASGLTCASSVCGLPAGASACTAGTRICSGPDIVQCSATGQGTTVVQTCPNGCTNGACIDPTCTLGARRCASDGVEQCTADSSGTRSWQILEACPAGCDADAGTCLQLTCNPLSVRCSPASANTIQTCSAEGTAWIDQACAPGATCSNGACTTPACTLGNERCGPSGVEACAAVANGPLAWQVVQQCPYGCDSATKACLQLACNPLSVRCGGDGTVQTCTSDGSHWSTGTACASGTRCNQGTCTALDCAPGKNSCNGNNLQTCNADGSGIAGSITCAQGCVNGACVQRACTPGATQCSGSAVQTCAPDGSGFVQTQACAANGCKTISAGIAACAVPVCTPLSLRCSADNSSVETCLADGSSWSGDVPCATGGMCSNGVCGAAPVACTSGALRCAGSSTQACQAGVWTTTGACLGSCSNGLCAGASCGAAVSVKFALPPCSGTACPPPADGASTLLAVAGPLTDGSGAQLADGTLVTVAATGGATIAAGDADASTAGIQVKSVAGYADFEILAPAASLLKNGTVHATVSAQIGSTSSCAGTASIDFVAAGAYAYVAEDFTTDAHRDFANTTANWRTDLGVAESIGFAFGNGSDGPLDLSAPVPTGGTFDLAQTPRGPGLPPYAPSLQVLGLNARAVQIQGSIAGFAAGDDVMLIELQGAYAGTATAAGTWELLRVASVADGTVNFTTPILGTYSNAPGAPLAGEKIALQRIPQFTNVNVPANVTLTASAWDGTQGGILAFRANGSVTVASAGRISADAIGYRAGTATTATINQAGESYAGQPSPASAPSMRNAGAGGGGYLLCDPAHLDQRDAWFGAGGSYGTAGFAGSTAGTPSAAINAGRAACGSTQGLTYGSPSLARLFPGSGSGTQQQDGHQSCNLSTCPSESRGPGYNAANAAALDYQPAFAATGGPQNSSFTFCAAETKSYTTAYQTAGASNCNTSTNPNCAQTFSQCGTLAAQFNGTTNTVGHPSFSYASDAPCTSAACTDTATSCSLNTLTYAQAWQANGSAGCEAASNSACATTYANCGSFNHTFLADTCLAGANCSATFAANNCGHFIANHGAAARPCGANASCTATFAACTGNLVNQATNTGGCFSSCPGLGVAHNNSCSTCGGCGTWNVRNCYPGQNSNGLGCGAPSVCNYVGHSGVDSGHNPFLCSSCNSNEYCRSSYCTGFLNADACCAWDEYQCYDGTSADGICPADGSGACNSCNTCQGASGTACATNPTGAGCDADCQTSAGCQTDPGCSHNPGCSNNPGCATNTGCSTNTGCDTCGARQPWDGAVACDFTNPSNGCTCPAPWTDVTQGGRGGGILFISALTIDLSAGGTISARGGAPGVTGKPGFAGGSGGSLWLRTGTMKLGSIASIQVDASGGVNAGAGRVRIERAGGDDPVALSRVFPPPYVVPFSLQQVQTVSLVPARRTALAALFISLSDPASTAAVEGSAPQVIQSLSTNGGTNFTPIAPGGLTTPFSTTDLRYRASFTPTPGAIARVSAFAFLIQLQ